MSASPAVQRCPDCSQPLPGQWVSELCPRCLAAMLGGDDGPVEPDEAQPARLGPYTLVSPLGRGGTGTVWRARREWPAREVALKVLRGALLPGESAVLRLRQEAEAVARLRHPGIVTLYEMGESDGCAWLAMELMEGGSLAERLAAARPAPREAAALVAKVARAVHHAHGCGVLHRDLKPHNIMLGLPAADGGPGEPRVTDFGLAHVAGTDHSLTVSGEIFGTPAYMPPEQTVGGARQVDERSDVYSLGAVLYELLEGRPPFVADSALELLRQVVQQEPAPPRAPGVDRDLATICLHGLEKKPAGRYTSALALAEDLERWLRGEPVLARRTGVLGRLWKWARRRPAVAALSAALLLTAAVGGGMVLHFARKPAAAGPPELDAATRRARVPLYVETACREIGEGDWFRAMSFLSEAITAGSGDAVQDRVNRIRFESLARFGPRLQQLMFPAAEDRFRTQLSADGGVLLVWDRRQARLWNSVTGAPLAPAISPGAEISGGEMNSDGTRLALTHADGHFSLWDPRTARLIVRREGSVRCVPPNLAVPRAVFAGDRFAAVQGNEIRQYRAVDGEPVGKPFVMEAPLLRAVLSTDGEYVFALTEEGAWHILQAASGEPTGEPWRGAGREAHVFAYRPVPNSTVWVHTENEATNHIDPPSGRIYAQSPSREPVLAQAWSNGISNVFILTSNERGFSFQESTTVFRVGVLDLGARGVAAGFSDSGDVAFGLAENGCGRFWDAVRKQPLGSRFRVAGPALDGVLSGDGKTLVVRSGLPALWIWRSLESDGATFTFPVSPPDTTTFSDDSSQLVAGTDSARRAWDLATGRMAGAITEVSPPHDPHLSPDGRKMLSWHEGPPGVNWLALRDTAPPGKRDPDAFVHSDPIKDAVFSPDGRLIAISDDRNIVQIWIAATYRMHLQPIGHPGPVSSMAFSPDGTLLATVCGEGEIRVIETATGLPVTPVLHHPSAAKVTWSPDGEWIVTFGNTSEVRVWNLSPGNRPPETIRALAQLLHAHRFAPGSDSIFTPLSAAELKAAQAGARNE